MRAVTGCNGKEFSGNGWQRSRATVAGNTQGNKGNTQGKAVMQYTLDIGGSIAR
ncbi:UNVERIFIED_ORG: hypothetical protein BDU10_3413 [Burkholderia sp. CF145]|jgi:hypothetical protein|uniref:hypothetical protein n=1 Tax=Paraburkholderia hospita TaxID=169430 RepID=UPI000271C81E|nr:hypothetical protein [Paraburkholderia hospita]EUC17933.1 hypothetical protein PMI06_003800 [Burkholderia sp. BT03]SKC74404.1 hypothetical protein SAMN05445504_1749 [Burkholderia sp. CF099]SKC90070.1 hypothetical protein SAMN06266956_4453 [Paraburkholderia hospita]